MLRFVIVSILLLLLGGCAQLKSPSSSISLPSVEESRANNQSWVNRFEQLAGTHISELNDLWGEPEELEKNTYRWSKREVLGVNGGRYVDDGYTTSRVYRTTGTGTSQYVGSIDTPKQRYVPFDRFEFSCEIQVTTDENGVITEADYVGESDGVPLITPCRNGFPFPEE